MARMGHPSYTLGKHWKLSKETKRKIGLANSVSKKGIKQTIEHRKNISKAMVQNPKITGENSYNWAGGISKSKYPPIFSNSLKFEIRKRDGFKCCLCGITETEQVKKIGRVLSVNHIDFDKSNCDPMNLNTLCIKCNNLINHDREKWTKFFKNK